jgi:hypothetical protein
MDAQIEVTRTATYRSATVAKLKDGSGEGREFMFKLPEVLLDFDIDEGDISSCVVEPIVSGAEQEAARQAAADQKQAKTSGRPTGEGKWASVIIETMESLCGPQNKPVHEQRLLDEAERVAKQTMSDLPKALGGSLRRGLESAKKAGKDVIHHPEDDTYTLRVPPSAPSDGD